MSALKLIVGLGNPGPKYALHRHNIGFMLVDKLAEQVGIGWKYQARFMAEIAEYGINSHKIMLVKPQTMMNLSAKSIQPLLSFYRLNPQQMLVIHDELDLGFGVIRTKLAGGAAGHNGLKSLDAAFGPNYHRLRLGIGRPPLKEEVVHYVLSEFTPDEVSNLKSIFDKLVKIIPLWWSGQPELFKETIGNLRTNPDIN